MVSSGACSVDRLPDRLGYRHRPHRLGAVGDRFRHRHQVGRNLEAVGPERPTGSPEAADHLIENQEDAMAVADVAQPLQVTFRRHQHAG